MRGLLTVSLIAVLAGGCASRDTMRAMQAPAPPPHGMVRFESDHRYRDTIAIEWVGGVSQRSYVFAEPNQRVIRPILQDALENTGLAAGTSVRSRYGLRVLVTNADGSELGADFDSEMAATYTLVDRQTGDEMWQREIRTPGVGYFLSFNEADWQTAWFIDPILAVYNVVNPLNYMAIASDSAADRARQYGAEIDQERMRRVVHDRHEWALEERGGHARAARANYAAVETNVTAFLVALAADNNVDMIPILPCHGSREVEERKREIVAAGGTFTTDDCSVRR